MATHCPLLWVCEAAGSILDNQAPLLSLYILASQIAFVVMHQGWANYGPGATYNSIAVQSGT